MVSHFTWTPALEFLMDLIVSVTYLGEPLEKIEDVDGSGYTNPMQFESSPTNHWSNSGEFVKLILELEKGGFITKVPKSSEYYISAESISEYKRYKKQKTLSEEGTIAKAELEMKKLKGDVSALERNRWIGIAAFIIATITLIFNIIKEIKPEFWGVIFKTK